MWGADTALVMDAIQVGGIALAAGGIAAWFFFKRRVQRVPSNKPAEPATNLEQRVQVLERIATDRAIGLSDEIEALRTQEKGVS